nr:nuclear transport factor 2 family protein [Kineococcus aurantiacus]
MLQQYFEVMNDGGDFARFFSGDVAWVNTDSGQRFTGPAQVREYVVALHTTTYEARPEGRSLSVTDAHAYLEGEFVATAEASTPGLRVPFCLVYDLDGEAIREMRLYTSFAALAPLARSVVPATGPASGP